MQPLSVTVCIPVYNPGPYLDLAIESILNQEYTDFELLIVDDNSAEAVEQIVQKYPDPRIDFYRNHDNLGLVGNWNRCLELASGKYVTVFHQDDLMNSRNLSRKIAVLDADPGIGFVFSDINRIDCEGHIIGGHSRPQPQKDLFLTGDQFFSLIAPSGNIISCPSVIMRRESYQRLGLFDSRLQFAVDLEMWLRIATRYNISYLAEPLIAHRVHPDQESARFFGTGQDFQDSLHAFEIVQSQSLSHNQKHSMVKAYETLSSQSLAMARWNFRHSKVSNGLRYAAVGIMAYWRSLQSSFFEQRWSSN